jgi:signal peptidase
MQPTINENTCIIIKEVSGDDLKVGDIITFVSENKQIYGFYNTHRINRIFEEDGVTKYETKGDANPEADEDLITYDQISGRYVRELPGGALLGKFFLALSDNRIYFFVVMLPLAVCLLSYLWQIAGYVTHRYDEEK